MWEYDIYLTSVCACTHTHPASSQGRQSVDLEALHMVVDVILQRQQCPGQLIQAGVSDMARQDHNTDKAAAGLAHQLLHIFRHRQWSLHCYHNTCISAETSALLPKHSAVLPNEMYCAETNVIVAETKRINLLVMYQKM